jgi:hypothetical protein
MATDPETRLALAAAVQRLANWTGTAVPPSPAAVVTLARQLEIAAHAEVERAVRQRPMPAPGGRRRRVGTERDPMTGPEHYQQAERLLEHAGQMLAEHVADEGLAELLQRQAVAVDMATEQASSRSPQWPA